MDNFLYSPLEELLTHTMQTDRNTSQFAIFQTHASEIQRLMAGEKAHLQDLVGFGELATSTTPFALVL